MCVVYSHYTTWFIDILKIQPMKLFLDMKYIKWNTAGIC